MFYKIEDENSSFTFVVAATDDSDFTIIADSSDAPNFLIYKQLGKPFEISDLEPIYWLLGVSITRDMAKHSISLGQHWHVYIEQTLH